MAEVQPIPTDAVLVPRHLLDAIADALASIVQVSGHGFGVLLERLDRHDGEPDAEDDDPAETVDDEQDAAWIEWQSTHPSTRSQCRTTGHEDDEEDDPGEDDDDDSAIDDQPCDDPYMDLEPDHDGL